MLHNTVFFFNDTATTEIYTLSLHDALPISYVQRFRTLAAQGNDIVGEARLVDAMLPRGSRVLDAGCGPGDRKSTRLNSSHANISYAVFCLKKNKSLNADQVNL